MIGIDILKVSRIDSLMKRKRFLERVFTDREKKYIESKNYSKYTIAGLLSAKEAVSKAFGVGISEELGFLDIEILHNDKNAIHINTENENLRNLMSEYNIEKLNLSISHDGEYAISVCKLLEKKSNSKIDSMLPERDDNSNKYTYGKVLIIGGSKGMSGSILLSSEAALRSGAGLVYTLVPECISQTLEMKTKEQIVLTLNDDGITEFGKFDREDLLNIIQNKSVIAIGPGLGTSKYAKEILEIVIYNFDGPIVIDADAINIFSENPELIREDLYLTPHAMEFSRLSGFTINEINYDRKGFVENFLDKYDVNILLKGRNSIVANKENTYINRTGNNGMSTAGSGDVLTGILSSLLAREDSFDMFKLSCFIHGLAGDLAAKRYGKTSLLARDIVDSLPYVLKELEGE